MILLAALFVQVAPAAAQPVSSQANTDIVVVGRNPATTGKALAECLARNCPPREDIAATLAHAETQFVSGDYKDAQLTLGASIKRNRRHASEMPEEVAGLGRAYTRTSGHLGEPDRERLSAFSTLDALKAGFPPGDRRILAERLEKGDLQARQNQVHMAVRTYRGVVRHARENGLPVIEGYARLRLASLYAALSLYDPGMWRPAARAALDDLAKTTGPEMAAFREAGRMLAAELAEARGDAGAVARLVAAQPPATSEQPRLIYAPPMATTLRDPGAAVSATGAAITAFIPDQWIDVGFWIERDGRVTEPAILRDSGRLQAFWTPPVLRAIAERRYGPLTQRQLRVERYTRTADLIGVTQSRMASRSPIPRIEMLDLTADVRTVPGRAGPDAEP